MADGLQVVWFKRDLRSDDHRPLVAAAAQPGPLLPLYVVEPELWAEPDADPRHWTFIRASLSELRDDLAARGAPLVIRIGDMVRLLERLHRQHPIAGLWSHSETGNAWTYARDRAVAAWCRARAVTWTEIPQNGVIRRLRSRDGWARRWAQRMAEPLVSAPTALRRLAGVEPGPLPTLADLGLPADRATLAQPGGQRAGQELLTSFLAGRGAAYHRSMSSPVTAEHGCSRLSPHLAWGTLSLRRVVHETERARTAPGAPKAALSAFNGRLHWHCHFMQKFEDQPAIEHTDLISALAGLRPADADPARLQAWATGRTGWPLVDACLRSLAATGWLTFRMRALVTSVAAYDLWLPWRPVGLHLARSFTDYEPGIHWSQVQMQSGTTGINTLRIYDPTKQARDQDPHGIFIHRWVPELARVPAPFVAAPWLMPPTMQHEVGCRIGFDYPPPIVDHTAAMRAAKAAFSALRAQPAFREQAQVVLSKHGSRKAQPQRKARKKPASRLPDGALQTSLFDVVSVNEPTPDAGANGQ